MVKDIRNDRQSNDQPTVADREIKRARRRAAVSIFLNLLLCLGKGAAGVMGGSVALVGDAVTAFPEELDTRINGIRVILHSPPAFDFRQSPVKTHSGAIGPVR